MTQKLYVYSDESGQDTEGRLFVVATMAVPAEDQVRNRGLLEHIEKESGKGKRKWTHATPRQRRVYMESVLRRRSFHGRLFYAHFTDTTAYAHCTLETIAGSVNRVAVGQPCDATILIDGLPRNLRHRSAASLRWQLPQESVRVEKVRGLNEQSDALMRLADALAGLVRHAMLGGPRR
ncbi:MAG: DUF3800 domain-containing protein [Candidatus Tectomicrobia bacterium]|nr:DUF3800 domain-containing protein [Candidatus Tectomicrobia bacterium]